MINPLAQVLARAETGLADLARRAVESVTVPLRAKGEALAAEVTATVKASLVAVAIRAGLGLFALVMFIVALCYGLAALHTELAIHFGPIASTLIIAGAFFALAIIALVAMLAWPSPRPATPAPMERAARDAEAVAAKVRREAEQARAAAASRASDAPAGAGPAASANPLADVTSGLGAIASALGEAGFRREQAGLRAGLALAEQLKPMQIVALALIGGFVAGVRHGPRRR